MALEIIISDIALKLDMKRYKKPNGDVIIDIPLEFTHDDVDAFINLMKDIQLDKLVLSDTELEDKLYSIVLKDKKEEAFNKLPLHIISNLILEVQAEVLAFVGFEKAEVLNSVTMKLQKTTKK